MLQNSVDDHLLGTIKEIKQYLSESPLKEIVTLFVFSRLLCMIVGYLVFYSHYPGVPFAPPGYVETGQGTLDWGLLNLFSFYDNANYLRIAQFGYTERLTVFFPLYPLLIRLLGGSLLASVLISNIAFFFALTIVYKSLGSRVAKLLSFSPVTIFFMSGYSESLFLLLSVVCLIALDRKKYLWATIFAALSFLSRSTGLILILLVPMIMLVRKEKFRKIITLNALASPLWLSYPLFLYINYGDFASPSTNNLKYFSRKLSFPLIGIWNDIQGFLEGALDMSWLLVVFLSILAVFYAFNALFKEKNALYSSYMLLYLLFVTSYPITSPYLPASHGLIRYLFGAISIYKQDEKHFRLFLIINIFLMIVITALVALKMFIA